MEAMGARRVADCMGKLVGVAEAAAVAAAAAAAEEEATAVAVFSLNGCHTALV